MNHGLTVVIELLEASAEEASSLRQKQTSAIRCFLESVAEIRTAGVSGPRVTLGDSCTTKSKVVNE